MFELFLVLLAGFAFTYLVVPWFIPRLAKAGLVGKDMNKRGMPEVPEMGGIPIIGGFIIAVLFAISLSTFGLVDFTLDLSVVLAALSTVLIMAIVGVIDDLILIDQRVKAVLPLFAALPLVALQAGVQSMDLPFFGTVNFGLIYPLLIVPLAITGAANATNMLAGFNGLEAGLGAIMCLTVGSIAFVLQRAEATVLAFAMAGSLLAFLRYNFNPARILIGDVGTLAIGALVASSVIVGNIEQAGVILIIPFFAELYLKARSRFQADSWCKRRGDRLVCEKADKIYGMGRLIMHLGSGVTETDLVLSLYAVELVFALLAVLSYFGLPGV